MNTLINEDRMDDTAFLGLMLASGVPSTTFIKDEVDDTPAIVARAFNVSKRQAREWMKQGAIKKAFTSENYMVIRVKKRAAVLILVEEKDE